jgi:hypothetical protein
LFYRTLLVDNFGGASLAWASMGLKSHRLDAKGDHMSDHDDLPLEA